VNTVPGWYGKLPSLGDFASRRWAEGLIDPWDHWLAEGLDALRTNDPEGWLEGYLNSPIWRFVIGTGVLGPAQGRPLAGVLMPSVDRVGRYFPLSIAVALERLPEDALETSTLMSWLHELDDIAADALQHDWTIETLEGHLNDHPAPRWQDTVAPVLQALRPLLAGETRLVELPMLASRPAMIGTVGQGLASLAQEHLLAPLSPGLTWWWCEPDAHTAGRSLLLARGLPRGVDFSRLLGPTPSHSAAAECAGLPTAQ
jgi:type VI secretion system protein ImpM